MGWEEEARVEAGWEEAGMADVGWEEEGMAEGAEAGSAAGGLEVVG